MAAWALAATVISGLLAVAGATLESLVLDRRLPARWLWVAAMTSSVLVPILLALHWTLPPPVPPHLGMPAAGPLRGSLQPVADALLQPSLFGPTLILWLFGSASVLAALAKAELAVRRLARQCGRQTVGGRSIMVTEDIGPAVFGLRRPEIVLPRWALGWNDEELELMVRHEREHIQARDQWLLYGSFVVLALQPWNAALWYQQFRLKEAIELDCDARVLRGSGAGAAYGLVLTRVAAMPAGLGWIGAGLIERSTALERRVRIALGGSRPIGAGVGAVLVAVAMLVVVLSSRVPVPAFRELATIALPDRFPLPGAPSLADELVLLRRHHPDVLGQGLPEEETVWFVVDHTSGLFETGVEAGADAEVHRRLTSRYGEDRTAFEISRIHSSDAGRTFRVSWYFPRPAALSR